jgi:tyrosinase
MPSLWSLTRYLHTYFQIYTSPNDPLFWLHHCMVDRVWWIWQNRKPLERSFQIAGTRTMNNVPPSDDATLDDILDLGIVTPANAPASALKHHVSTVAGPYCYIYA